MFTVLKTMDAIRAGVAHTGIQLNTFRFSSLPTSDKAKKLKEILEKTSSNTDVVYVFEGSRELNDITLYIRKEIEKVRAGRSRDMSFANMYMFVFFDGFLLPIGQDNDSVFWTSFFRRKRESRTDNLRFFEKGVCLKACSAVVCEACVETFQCPVCRHPNALTCFGWDPDVGEPDDQPRHYFRLTT